MISGLNQHSISLTLATLLAGAVASVLPLSAQATQIYGSQIIVHPEKMEQSLIATTHGMISDGDHDRGDWDGDGVSEDTQWIQYTNVKHNPYGGADSTLSYVDENGDGVLDHHRVDGVKVESMLHTRDFQEVDFIHQGEWDEIKVYYTDKSLK